MINVDTVQSLFVLFSGQDITENAPFLILARSETERILLPDVPDTDERVNFLCAAIANYRYQQAKASGDRSAYTYAGEMIKADKYTPLAFAESMLKDYYQMCRDIIKPQNFIFMGFSSEEDLK
ncbi:MAG: hypothetical protein NC340_01630 [Ruminococcus flavefaciens]|nr:hypothetical protein [Ruminococcus flavefaciens]MCM1228847.1 hypothetical protein [Ruminococcus flavefaciens]